jgi:hypothetical protein
VDNSGSPVLWRQNLTNPARLAWYCLRLVSKNVIKPKIGILFGWGEGFGENIAYYNQQAWLIPGFFVLTDVFHGCKHRQHGGATGNFAVMTFKK